MRFHETKGSVWEDCTVEGLKDLEDGKGTQDFLVRWSSSGAEAELEPVGRLRIVVQGEDPEVYADRILFAFEALQKAQARIRLNFFVDNMPVDGLQTLDDDQVTRVLDLSRNSAALREVPDSFCSVLVREANLDFARTMNKIVLIADPQVQKPPGYRYQQGPGQLADLSSLLDDIDIDDLEDAGENPFEREVPWFSLWPVPEYCFTDAFSSFCFASLYIRPEVVSSLGEVCQENLNLMASCIYANRFTRLMKPEQFRQIERSAITTMAHKIREQWEEWSQTRQVLQEMTRRKLTLDDRALRAGIEASTATLDWQESLKLLEQMEDEDAEAMGRVMTTLSTCQQWAQAQWRSCLGCMASGSRCRRSLGIWNGAKHWAAGGMPRSWTSNGSRGLRSSVRPFAQRGGKMH